MYLLVLVIVVLIREGLTPATQFYTEVSLRMLRPFRAMTAVAMANVP